MNTQWLCGVREKISTLILKMGLNREITCVCIYIYIGILVQVIKSPPKLSGFE